MPYKICSVVCGSPLSPLLANFLDEMNVASADIGFTPLYQSDGRTIGYAGVEIFEFDATEDRLASTLQTEPAAEQRAEATRLLASARERLGKLMDEVAAEWFEPPYRKIVRPGHVTGRGFDRKQLLARRSLTFG